MNGEKDFCIGTRDLTNGEKNFCIGARVNRVQMSYLEARDMAQWVIACAALPEDPSRSPRSHMLQGLRLFYSLWTPTLMCIYPHPHTHVTKNNLFFKCQIYLNWPRNLMAVTNFLVRI